MSGVINNVISVIRADNRPLLLALLLHGVLLLVLLTTKIPQLAQALEPEAIVSYLYQPQPPVPSDIAQPSVNDMPTEPEVVAPVPQSTAPEVTPQKPTGQTQGVTESLPDIASTQLLGAEAPTAAIIPRPSLAQRALNKAATVNPASIEQAAAASYQQLLQAQQQPKITVEKRHQQLSIDPARQVFAQLNNGQQLIRTKGGCRFADPTKEGFDALMVANAVVPCGDEEHSSALLKQALEKHIKR
ncbi:hypothetical protein E0Z06_00305 [Rheinheimera sp. D18]|uniref:hypothetical protein n=1 Tax=Rheinheimera sp. D18 TaxID=2545632 RepID=UPI0010501D0F|nr:hypothetical protein [Rheinheimera sp. D18]QBL08061.1 hypothetical protein E0Z06_00305 [Rheinheimera sp. D18]